MPKRYYPVVLPAFEERKELREGRGINYKREPKGLESFKRMYPLVTKRPTIGDLTPEKARDATRTILSMIPRDSLARQGEGTRFLFPLGSSTGMAEFVKGILKVKAPNAKVSLLVVPYSGIFANGARPQDAMSNLHGHLSRAITKNDRHIVVLDDIWEGKTTNAIRDALTNLQKANPALKFSASTYNSKFSIFPYLNLVLDSHWRTPSGKKPRLEKDNLGSFAAPGEDYNQRQLKHEFSFWSRLIKSIPKESTHGLEKPLRKNYATEKEWWAEYIKFLERMNKFLGIAVENATKLIEENPEYRKLLLGRVDSNKISANLYYFMKKHLGFREVSSEPTFSFANSWKNADDLSNTVVFALNHFPTEREVRGIMTKLTNRRSVPIGTHGGLKEGLKARQATMVMDRKTNAFYRRYLYNLGIASALEESRFK